MPIFRSCGGRLNGTGWMGVPRCPSSGSVPLNPDDLVDSRFGATCGPFRVRTARGSLRVQDRQRVGGARSRTASVRMSRHPGAAGLRSAVAGAPRSLSCLCPQTLRSGAPPPGRATGRAVTTSVGDRDPRVPSPRGGPFRPRAHPTCSPGVGSSERHRQALRSPGDRGPVAISERAGRPHRTALASAGGLLGDRAPPTLGSPTDRTSGRYRPPRRRPSVGELFGDTSRARAASASVEPRAQRHRSEQSSRGGHVSSTRAPALAPAATVTWLQPC